MGRERTWYSLGAMRDVSTKFNTLRTAVAQARVRVSPNTIRMIREGTVPKGDPIPVARIAGISAVKATPQLIPYCHPVPIDHASVEVEIKEAELIVHAKVIAVYRTGVEMEALTAASVAALNLYDVLKMIDDEMTIEQIVLLKKTGGKSDLPRPSKGDLSAAVIVVSDSVSRGENTDRSGVLIVERLCQEGLSVSSQQTVPDEPQEIINAVEKATGANLLVLTGGTGVGPRDVTPEAVSPLLDRSLPGVEETIRSYGQARTPYAMLSRTVAGVIGESIVLCLPGAPSAVTDAMNAVFPALLHAIDMLRGKGHRS